MMKGIVDVAYRDGKRPKTLPNLRYIGVGPDPSQIIRDVPQTEKLLALAGS
jgi:adenylosuccinate synthase